MEKFTSYEIFSCALVWLFTSLLRLAAEVMRKSEAGTKPHRLSFWRVLFHFAATATVAFLVSTWLHETDWPNGRRMLALFLATFLAPALIDALMLISGKMLLAEFAKWLATKTGAGSAADFPENSSPTNVATDDDPENSQ